MLYRTLFILLVLNPLLAVETPAFLPLPMLNDILTGFEKHGSKVKIILHKEKDVGDELKIWFVVGGEKREQEIVDGELVIRSPIEGAAEGDTLLSNQPRGTMNLVVTPVTPNVRREGTSYDALVEQYLSFIEYGKVVEKKYEMNFLSGKIDLNRIPLILGQHEFIELAFDDGSLVVIFPDDLGHARIPIVTAWRVRDPKVKSTTLVDEDEKVMDTKALFTEGKSLTEEEEKRVEEKKKLP